jgi:hypothetical protein
MYGHGSALTGKAISAVLGEEHSVLIWISEISSDRVALWPESGMVTCVVK